MIKVSLIVPAYNEEKYIEKNLKSLRNQTYNNYEIIVINNNSTDNTEKIAKKFTKRVYNEKKQGYHAAINRGVKEAKGEIIATCDADTFYPKNWLEKAVKKIDKNSVGAYGISLYYDGNFLLRIFGSIFIFLGSFLTYITGIPPSPGNNLLVKKKAYLIVGGYDTKIFDGYGWDLELGMRLKKIGKYKFVPNLIAYTSARRTKEENLMQCTRELFLLWWNLWKKTPEKIRKAVNYNQKIR